MYARRASVWSIIAAFIGTGSVCMPTVATATVLQSFDQIFQGDDPSERFDFPLPFDLSTPIILRFDGYIENLDAFDTGIQFGFRWQSVDGTSFPGDDFPSGLGFLSGVALPHADPVLGTTQAPIHLSSTPGYTPAEVRFAVEGLGGADNFRLFGDLSVTPVPEPSTLALTALGALGLLIAARRRR